MKKILLTLALALALAATAQATPVTFTGTSGSLAASATFDFDTPNTLKVTLTNTSLADVLIPADVLTGVFFSINNGVTLSPVSASLDGSTVFFGPDGGGNVGGEWEYASGLSGAPGGANRGISSAGLGLFGDANFNGANLQGPSGVDGLQYGIIPTADNTANGNVAVTGGFALIQNHVLFTLSYTGTIAFIRDVSFQYGTALSEPNYGGTWGGGTWGAGVPDGGTTAALLGLSMLGLGFLRRLKG